MKKVLSLIIISAMLILSLSLSFAYAEDDGWKTVEQSGFALSAKINYNGDKTDIESIDLKMENKTGEEMALVFPTPLENGFNWWYSLSFSNEKGHYRCSKGDMPQVLHNFDVPAGAVIFDTIYPKDEDFKKNNSLEFDEILKGDCVLNISTTFFTQEFVNGNASNEENYKMNLSFDMDLNNSEITTNNNPTPQPTNNTSTPTNAQPTTNNKAVPNPPTDVEGIAVALVTAITACGALVLTSKKK